MSEAIKAKGGFVMAQDQSTLENFLKLPLVTMKMIIMAYLSVKGTKEEK